MTNDAYVASCIAEMEAIKVEVEAMKAQNGYALEKGGIYFDAADFRAKAAHIWNISTGLMEFWRSQS